MPFELRGKIAPYRFQTNAAREMAINCSSNPALPLYQQWMRLSTSSLV